MGKSIPAATKLYLSAVKKKQTTKEITNALRDGGVESTSKNFDNIVTTALHRLRMSGVLLRFKDGGWGLAELYPANIRASIGQPSKAKQATKRYRSPKKKTKRARTKKKPGEGLEARLAGHLHAHPDEAFTPIGSRRCVRCRPTSCDHDAGATHQETDGDQRNRRTILSRLALLLSFRLLPTRSGRSQGDLTPSLWGHRLQTALAADPATLAAYHRHDP